MDIIAPSAICSLGYDLSRPATKPPHSILPLLGSSFQVTSCSFMRPAYSGSTSPWSPVFGPVDCTSLLVHPCFYSELYLGTVPGRFCLSRSVSSAVPSSTPWPVPILSVPRLGALSDQIWSPVPGRSPCSPFVFLETPQNPILFSPTTPPIHSFLTLISPLTQHST